MQIPHLVGAFARLVTPVLAPFGLAAPLALVLAAPAAAQDTLAPGFVETAHQPVPVPFASYETLSSGDRVVFDGQSIDLYDASGVFVTNLATLPAFVFNSFVEKDPTETYVLVGESSFGDIYRVDLAAGGATLVANLPFNYDCAFEDADHALVSAATCGFGCGNDLVRVEVSTGTVTPVASLPGASGPLAFEANGDLVYATVSDQFPPPPGSSEVVRFTAAELASGQVLSLADADVLASGFDGAASLAVDPVFGNLLLAESVFGGTSRILEIDPTDGSADVVVTSANFLSKLELFPGGGLGHFHAFQPSDGVFLHYSSDEIRTIRPQRPQLTVSQTGQAVDVTITGAMPNAAVYLLWGANSAWSPVETSYQIPGMDFLFHTGFVLNQIRRGPWLLPTDANGTAVFSYFDPGNLAGTLHFQALVTDATGAFIGSSTAAGN